MARRKVGSTRKRKSTPAKRKTTHRRRRIGSVGSGAIGGILMKGVALGAGAIAGRELNAVVVKMMPSLTPMMSGAGQVAIGAMLPMFVKNNKFVADMGDGMMANGFMVMAVSTGIISGSSDRVTYQVNGITRNRFISGANGGNIPRIAGPAAGAHIPTMAGVGRVRRSNVGCV